MKKIDKLTKEEINKIIKYKNNEFKHMNSILKKNKVFDYIYVIKANEFIISDKYATILTVISYPRYINPGFLSSLTSMSGIKVVIKHIPMPFSVIQKMLNKEISDLRSRYQQEKDRTIQERIRQDVDSLEYFIQQFTASQAKTFDFQMHIMMTNILKYNFNALWIV